MEVTFTSVCLLVNNRLAQLHAKTPEESKRNRFYSGHTVTWKTAWLQENCYNRDVWDE